MDPKVLALIGAGASAVIAALSYMAKTRHERRRATRTVLYHLLEVHHLARRVQTGLKDFSPRYAAYCRDALAASGSVMSETDAASASALLQQIVRRFTAAESEELSAALAEPFAKALDELSREDPVLAFRLRGRDQLLRLAAKLDAAVSSVPPEEGAAQDGMPIQSHPLVEDFIREITAKELESAIRMTAWRCDVITHARVRLLLRRIDRERTPRAVDALIKELADKLIAQLDGAAGSGPAAAPP